MEIKFTNPGVKKRQGSFSGSSADSGQVIEFTQQAAAVLNTLLSYTIQVCSDQSMSNLLHKNAAPP